MARKEIKADVGGLRKTVTAQRSEIAALKRDVKALTSQLKAVLKAVARQDGAGKAAAPEVTDAPARRGRRFKFDEQALATKREQLGVSQQAMATLLEASTLSVSRWESGKVAPRAAQLERIHVLTQ